MCFLIPLFHLNISQFVHFTQPCPYQREPQHTAPDSISPSWKIIVNKYRLQPITVFISNNKYR